MDKNHVHNAMLEVGRAQPPLKCAMKAVSLFTLDSMEEEELQGSN